MLLSSFQIIRRFDFSRYTVFAVYLYIYYDKIYRKNNISRKGKMSYNLERSDYVIENKDPHHLSKSCDVT